MELLRNKIFKVVKSVLASFTLTGPNCIPLIFLSKVQFWRAVIFFDRGMRIRRQQCQNPCRLPFCPTYTPRVCNPYVCSSCSCSRYSANKNFKKLILDLLRVGQKNKVHERSFFLAKECVSGVKNLKKKKLQDSLFSRIHPESLQSSCSNMLVVNIWRCTHMGHRDQDGKKIDDMSLFFFKVRSWYGQIKAKIDIILSPSILS